MEKEQEVELILSSLSIFFLGCIIILFSLFPAIFLKHPNQLYLCSIIFQIITLGFGIAESIILIKLNLADPEPRHTYIALAFIESFAFLMFYHYIVALNLEIIFKIFNTSSQKYKFRVRFYHIASFIVSLIIIIVLL